MPVEISPNEIELDRLDGGWSPDTPESGVPINASPDMLNLVLERGALAPETRKGFERLSAGRSDLSGHYVKNLYYYETIDAGVRRRYLMAVMSNGAEAANNVQVWAYDLTNDTFERVDTAGRQWNSPKSPHWGIVAPGRTAESASPTYYGGVRGDAIYSWHPTEGWDDDPTAAEDTLKEWVDAVNDDVDTDSEVARDYAFKEKQKVTYQGEVYSSLRDIRFDKWDDSEQYKVGDRVSRRHVWASTESYWKSFECIRTHTAGDNNAPGTGDGWKAYWKKVKNPPILDNDDEVTDAWTPAQHGVKSSIGVFYGDRLMVRRDNEDTRSLVQYSAPLDTSAKKKKHNQKIADLVWNPKDWAEVDSIEGEGGGHFYVTDGKGDAIRGMYSMGNYLVIAKRWTSHVLAGRSEATWQLRKLGDQGVVALNCLTECDGFLYGLSHNGTLWVTDGTTLREVPGYEKTREYIKERIDRLLQNNDATDEDDERWFPSLFTYDHKVWVSLPDEHDAGTPDDVTLVYDPADPGSWWKLDLPILSAVVGAKNRAARLWFGSAKRSGNATLFEYGDDPGDLVFTDDDYLAASGSVATDAIPWHFRTAWFQWGLMHRNRRIRRTWALVKSAVSVTMTAYENFVTSSSVWARTDTVESGQGSTHFEGKSIGHPVSSLSLKVSGTAATGGPAIIGLGVDTQPVRKRFRRN